MSTMSKEESEAFKKVVTGAIDAFVAAEKTGQSAPLVAASDQIEAYRKEYDTKLSISLGDKTL